MDSRLNQIADHYGLSAQLDILQEECAELIQAVSKFRRTQNSDIVEEIADVYIMLNQVVYLLNKNVETVDVEEFVACWMEKKIRRQLERINADTVIANPQNEGEWKEDAFNIICPFCGMTIDDEVRYLYPDNFDLNFCPNCGKKLRWKGGEE